MKKFLLLCLVFMYAVVARGAVTFEQLSPEEKLGQTLVVFVDVDSAELSARSLKPDTSAACSFNGAIIRWRRRQN